MSLAPTHSPAASPTPATLRRLASEIESQAVAAFFQPVFATLPTGDFFGGGNGEAQWRPMLVDAIARDVSRGRGLGIGEAVYRELLRIQERVSDPGATPPTPPPEDATP